MKLQLRKLIGWALLVLVFVVVGYFIAKNFNELKKYNFDLRASFIVLAFITELSAYLAKLAIWQNLSGSYGLKVPFIRAGKGFFLSQFGRYIPGKVGLFLVRMEAYKGFSRKATLVATGVEFISSLGAACILVLIGILSSSQLLPSYALWGSIGGLVLVLLFLWPPVFRPISTAFFKLIKRAPLEEIPPYKTTLKFVFLYLLPGLLHGFSLYLVLSSLSPINFDYYLTITSVYFAAGLIGLASLFAPSGIGVREGVMMLILPLFIDTPVVIVGVIIIRLVITAAEITLAGVFTALDRLSGVGPRMRGSHGEFNSADKL